MPAHPIGDLVQWPRLYGPRPFPRGLATLVLVRLRVKDTENTAGVTLP